MAKLNGGLAIGLLIIAVVGNVLASNMTAWMHNLLSYSYMHPVPAGAGCDYGVVLGYALHRNGSCTRPLQSRVEVGVAGYQKHQLNRLVFSGSNPGGGVRNVSEANAMLHYGLTLLSKPPQVGRWLLEEASTSTRTNAVYSLHLIMLQQEHKQQQGLHTDQRLQQGRQQYTVVIITNPFHQLRSYFTFKRAAEEAGMDVQFYVAKAPFAGHCGYGHWLIDSAMDQWDFWRELGAIAYYAARGWLQPVGKD
eukprot:GHRR01016383.1.p1 GENE.GHRR01016383.1~~GHRR01016383.1.p1  ORF type:complete len:250 (+),score=61.10 GHRR01016383.1:329-1078(+)